MRFLVLSSLFLVCVFSLSAQRVSTNTFAKELRPKFESEKYQASIDVIGKHLSGILIFKRQEDSSIRVAFVNEIGMTFFDMSFYDESYTFHSIAHNLNKKAVKISLAKDIGMILLRGIFKENATSTSRSTVQLPAEPLEKYSFPLKRKGIVVYQRKRNEREIPLIENFGKKKKIITITQNYTDKNSMPERIFVEHHTVRFTILLKRLHVTE
ncbi:MAG: hypothetical protein IPK62_15225 [Bacteroidetes bacterium]|nr:hypothetical protein [Bacteroidota bacterium]